MSNTPKKFFSSKTFWGILLTVFQIILKQAGWEIPVISGDGMLDAGTAMSGGLTVWGLRDAVKNPKE